MGGEVLNKVLYGEALLWDPTPYPSVYHFWQKTYPFWTASIDKWYPFHISSLECWIPFNCCKCTLFKIWIDHKIRSFSQLFHGYKVHLLALLGQIQTKMTDFPTLSLVQLMKSPPIHIAEAWKRYPFQVEPPCISHYREPMGSSHLGSTPLGKKAPFRQNQTKEKQKPRKVIPSLQEPHTKFCIHVFHSLRLYRRGCRKSLTPDNSMADKLQYAD